MKRTKIILFVVLLLGMSAVGLALQQGLTFYSVSGSNPGVSTGISQVVLLNNSWARAGATIVQQWQPVVVVTYSASMTPDASQGQAFNITATDGNAFTINNPTNPSNGQTMTIRIRNTSGGAAGSLTFGAAFKTGAAWTQPATTKSRSIDFVYDGTSWVETNRSAADVAN